MQSESTNYSPSDSDENSNSNSENTFSTPPPTSRRHSIASAADAPPAINLSTLPVTCPFGLEFMSPLDPKMFNGVWNLDKHKSDTLGKLARAVGAGWMKSEAVDYSSAEKVKQKMLWDEETQTCYIKVLSHNFKVSTEALIINKKVKILGALLGPCEEISYFDHKYSALITYSEVFHRGKLMRVRRLSNGGKVLTVDYLWLPSSLEDQFILRRTYNKYKSQINLKSFADSREGIKSEPLSQTQLPKAKKSNGGLGQIASTWTSSEDKKKTKKSSSPRPLRPTNQKVALDLLGKDLVTSNALSLSPREKGLSVDQLPLQMTFSGPSEPQPSLANKNAAVSQSITGGNIFSASMFTNAGGSFSSKIADANKSNLDIVRLNSRPRVNSKNGRDMLKRSGSMGDLTSPLLPPVIEVITNPEPPVIESFSCTYNGDKGVLNIQGSTITFLGFHFNFTIPGQEVKSISKKERNKLTVTMNNSVFYVFKDFSGKRADAYSTISSFLKKVKDGIIPTESKKNKVKILDDLRGENDEVTKGSFGDNWTAPAALPANLAFTTISPKDKLVHEADYPLSLKDFFTITLSDSSTFATEVLEKTNTSDVEMTKWQLDDTTKSFWTRKVDSKKKSRFATCIVHQQQRFMRQSQTEFAYEEVNKMEGVPYSDAFSVAISWKVTYNPDNETTNLKAYVRVDFERSFLLKGQVEKGTVSGTSEYYEDFNKLIKTRFQYENASEDPANSNNGAGGANASSKSIEDDSVPFYKLTITQWVIFAILLVLLAISFYQWMSWRNYSLVLEAKGSLSSGANRTIPRDVLEQLKSAQETISNVIRKLE